MTELKTDQPFAFSLFEKPSVWWCVVLFLTAIILYWPSLFNGFVWDDQSIIVNNYYFHNLSDLSMIFSSSNAYSSRPVFSLSILADYRIWGLRPFGYHLTNILLHGANVVLLFLLLWKLFSKKISIVAGFIFAVHAVNSESVDWILNRSGLLAMFFSLASLNLYFSAKKRQQSRLFYLLSFVAFALAVLSKETSIILPFIVISYEALFGNGKDTLKRSAYTILPLLAIAVIYFWWWTGGSPLNVFRSQKYWGGSPYMNFLMMMTVFADYIRLLIFPLDLRAWYIANKNVSIMNLHVLAGIYLLVFGLFVAFFYRKKYRILSFSIFWLLIGLLPVSNIIHITGSMMSERWLYFPMIGFCIAAGSGFEYLYEKKGALSRNFQKAAVFALLFFLILHSARAFERHRHWKDTESMFTELLKKNPDWANGHNILAVVHFNEGRIKEAAEEVKKAIKLDPEYPYTYETLASLMIYSGKFRAAEASMRKLFELKPDSQTGYVKLGIALMYQRKYSEAIDAIEKAKLIEPYNPDVYMNFGYVYYMMDELDKSETYFEKVLNLSPGNIEALKVLEVISIKKSRKIN